MNGESAAGIGRAVEALLLFAERDGLDPNGVPIEVEQYAVYSWQVRLYACKKGTGEDVEVRLVVDGSTGKFLMADRGEWPELSRRVPINPSDVESCLPVSV
jgi:hypothetical protein